MNNWINANLINKEELIKYIKSENENGYINVHSLLRSIEKGEFDNE